MVGFWICFEDGTAKICCELDKECERKKPVKNNSEDFIQNSQMNGYSFPRWGILERNRFGGVIRSFDCTHQISGDYKIHRFTWE